MSLVGTRPPTVDEWELYEPHHRARMSFRPGLTGMWQVSGRSNTLVKRCVTNPHDVFDLVDRYCKKNEIPVPDDFKDKRITAERMVNQKNKRPSTIREIYDFFCQE